MDTNLVVALASVVSGAGVAAAAVVAAYSLRAQSRAQHRQTDLENMRWLAHEWKQLRPERRAGARGLLAGEPEFPPIREVMNFLETCGHLVRHGLVDQRTLAVSVGEMAVRGWWHWAEDYIRERRAAMAGQQFWVDVEWLQGRLADEAPDGPWLDGFLEREAAISDNGSGVTA